MYCIAGLYRNVKPSFVFTPLLLRQLRGAQRVADSRTPLASRTARAFPPRAPPSSARSAWRSACTRRRGRCPRARSVPRASRTRAGCRTSRRSRCSLAHRIGDRHQLAARVALEAGEVRELGPSPGAQHADAHLVATNRPHRRHSITAEVSPGSMSMRCARIGAMPFVMKRS